MDSSSKSWTWLQPSWTSFYSRISRSLKSLPNLLLRTLCSSRLCSRWSYSTSRTQTSTRRASSWNSSCYSQRSSWPTWGQWKLFWTAYTCLVLWSHSWEPPCRCLSSAGASISQSSSSIAAGSPRRWNCLMRHFSTQMSFSKLTILSTDVWEPRQGT